jgi:hypothetical protein
MKRRQFLATGFWMAGALATRRMTVGQVPGAKRGAVVIGVDKAGDLPKLRAAASGARAVAEWLRSEAFEVKLFIDDTGPVEAPQLLKAISGFIDRGTLEQLVVYFAGHGFVSGTVSEMWLLSDAPRDPNAAVALYECAALAEQSGIPNVVFISDACRSRADTLGTERVRGGIIFPSQQPGRGANSDVDQFLATRVGAAAYEYTVAQSTAAFQGIYTECFLDAFKHPYADMIVQAEDGKQVIPNRRLKRFLAQEVPKRAQAVAITLEQRPDSKVLSDEPTYIAHVSGPAQAPATGAVPTVSDVAASRLRAAGIGLNAPAFSAQAIEAAATKSGFEAALATIAQARGLPAGLEVRTGFVISGQRLESVMASPGIRVKLSNSAGAARPGALVEVDAADAHAASVALRFVDGTGTVLAALDTYIGNVVVEEGKVSNVSYLPSHASPMRGMYEAEGRAVEQMHAAVSTAAQFGVFRIEGPKETRQAAARQLADRIRMLKAIDPTLGLYAAYAYAEAGIPDQARSVRDIMRGDLRTDLFDVAMLAGGLEGRNLEGREGPVPFCPMLSQGWGQLRVRRVQLADDIAAIRDHLRVSLWTTLDGDGMSMAERILRSGRVR